MSGRAGVELDFEFDLEFGLSLSWNGSLFEWEMAFSLNY